MDIGNAIKTCRIRRGYSQTKLAELAECSVSYLSLIEHNQRDITLSTLQKICHALHVPIGILLFLGTSHDEFGEMSKELEAELAKSTLVLLSAPANEQNNWSNVFVQSPDINLRKESRFWREHFSLIRFLSRTIKNARSDDLAFCNQYRLNLTSFLLLSA